MAQTLTASDIGEGLSITIGPTGRPLQLTGGGPYVVTDAEYAILVELGYVSGTQLGRGVKRIAKDVSDIFTFGEALTLTGNTFPLATDAWELSEAAALAVSTLKTASETHTTTEASALAQFSANLLQAAETHNTTEASSVSITSSGTPITASETHTTAEASSVSTLTILSASDAYGMTEAVSLTTLTAGNTTLPFTLPATLSS